MLGAFLKYFIILVIVFIALSPLISMRPSARKLKQAKLRQLAFSLGLQVNLCEMPGAKPGREAVNGVCYRLQSMDRKHSFGQKQGSFVRIDGSWSSIPPVSEQLQSVLAGLPELVSAASIESNSCAVYWQEDGDSEDVEKICQVLKELMELKE